MKRGDRKEFQRSGAPALSNVFGNVYQFFIIYIVSEEVNNIIRQRAIRRYSGRETHSRDSERDTEQGTAFAAPLLSTTRSINQTGD